MSNQASLFSPHWYRVGFLTPQLQSHVEVQRNEYRGLIWYILSDSLNGRSHRFNATAYQAIGAMDGKTSLDTIWNQLADQLGEYAPSQDELIQIVSRLHQADALKMEVPAEAEDYLTRGARQKSTRLRQRIGNPLALRLPLWDPDAVLARWAPHVSWLFAPLWLSVWSLLMIAGAFAGLMHTGEIVRYGVDNGLDPLNVIYLVLLYPLIKFIHELGHGLATRHYGGEVHEMGVTLLLFMPVPYVDVSSANGFRSRRQRIVVSAAGIIVELALAVLALFVFLMTSPGWVQQLSYNILLIGGVSSLLFNGNPLLRYDGYYVLSDALAIPNLYQRAPRYYLYLIQKIVFGVPGLHSPANAPGERGWLLFYGAASTAYRLILLWWIVGFLIDSYLVVGALLGLWVVASQLLFPMFRGLRFIATSSLLNGLRWRALTVTGAVLVSLGVLLLWWPATSVTYSQGVVSLPENAILRAQTSGVLSDFYVDDNDQIEAGDVVVDITDPELESAVTVLELRLQELNTEYRSVWDQDRVEADNIKEQMKVVAAELREASHRLQSRRLQSLTNGRVVIPDQRDLPGSFVQKGDVIGYVLDRSPPIVHVAVEQTDMGFIQSGVRRVDIKLLSDPANTWAAEITRRSPEGTFHLPHLALSRPYGGPIAVRSSDSGEWLAREKIFVVDVTFHPDQLPGGIGQRVMVRFDHGKEPLAVQWARRLQQTFLGRLHG